MKGLISVSYFRYYSLPIDMPYHDSRKLLYNFGPMANAHCLDILFHCEVLPVTLNFANFILYLLVLFLILLISLMAELRN